MRFIIYALLLLSLAACGPAKEDIDPTAEWSAERFYLEARAELDDGNYLTAIEYYETLSQPKEKK